MSHLKPGAEPINSGLQVSNPFPSIHRSMISRGPSAQPAVVLMVLLPIFQRSIFVLSFIPKLCKRTPLDILIVLGTAPRVHLSHCLPVKRASLSVLKLLSLSCHICVILTLCLPPLRIIPAFILPITLAFQFS